MRPGANGEFESINITLFGHTAAEAERAANAASNAAWASSRGRVLPASISAKPRRKHSIIAISCPMRDACSHRCVSVSGIKVIAINKSPFFHRAVVIIPKMTHRLDYGCARSGFKVSVQRRSSWSRSSAAFVRLVRHEDAVAHVLGKGAWDVPFQDEGSGGGFGRVSLRI